MQCPICKSDLSPLDVGSRIEHVDCCLENGPSTVEVSEEGRMIIKKTVDPKKQRKICPICDKTFQQLNSHFKNCALKNDVPPNLMLDYWERINKDSKVSKKFPRELLDNFIIKCIKEGRDGEQVDIARALSLSMSDGKEEPAWININDENSMTGPTSAGSTCEAISTNGSISSGTVIETRPSTSDANQILMNNGENRKTTRTTKTKSQSKTYRLQLVDDALRRSNVDLRIDRELAASRSKRYNNTIALSKSHVLFDPCDNNQDDDDCVILIQETQSTQSSTDDDLSKIFYRARLKTCDGSAACLKYECTNHDMELLLAEFKKYTGPTIDADPKRTDIMTNTSIPVEQC